MKKWRAGLVSFTGIYIVIGIWTPVIWFMSSARAEHQMLTFEISRMHWSSIMLFIALLCATLVAQLGFVVLAKEHGEYDELKDRYPGPS